MSFREIQSLLAGYGPFIGHLSFALVGLSYLVKDIFWLRSIAICACMAAIFYDLLLPDIQWLRIFWNSFFVTVNIVQIILLVKENRGVSFTEEEKELYDTIFQNFAPVEFMKILNIAHWIDAKPEDILIEEGSYVENVMLICDGSVRVEVNGDVKAYLKNHDFVGEMSFLTGEKASATVKADIPTRYLAWPQGALRNMMNRSPSIKFAFQSVLSNDLTKKLRS